MLKALLIENEKYSAEQLAALLQKHCRQDVQLCAMFDNAEKALKEIKSIHPQLVFLSTEINGKSGFEFLNHIQKKSFETIFISDTSKHAFEAFKHNALDYLIKPVDPKELTRRALGKLNSKKSGDVLSVKMENLTGNIEQLKHYTSFKKIMVPTLSGFELLPVIDILRCESDINYTTIHLKDKQKLVVAKTLKEYEELLSDYNFFRIHNSHLINLAYIKSYNKGKGGSAILTDGTELEVSTRRKDDFLAKLAAL